MAGRRPRHVTSITGHVAAASARSARLYLEVLLHTATSLVIFLDFTFDIIIISCDPAHYPGTGGDENTPLAGP